MNWSDEGFLISKNRYSENSLISEIYTKDQEKFQVLFLVELQKRLKTIFKLEINYM